MTCERAGCRAEAVREVETVLGTCELCEQDFERFSGSSRWPAWFQRIFARRRAAVEQEHRE